MNTLAIDLETFSSVDIRSAGMYKYVQSDDFEILLCAYSINGTPVECFEWSADTAEAQLFRDVLTTYLLNPEYLKSAFNAPFEIACLSKALGVDLDASQWSCTMAKAAQVGLPLSLEQVASMLKLSEQKDTKGKALIKYFCMPCKATKANGGGTRNLPEHAPEKWEAFKEYCRQDVVTEQAVRTKIDFFEVPPMEVEIWNLDQKINRTGILIDPLLVRNAIRLDLEYKEKITAEAVTLTGLDNPNSVAQLKRWLETETGEAVESLDKKALPELLASASSDTVREMLRLRGELSKTSVKKYAAMMKARGTDNRIRGLLQYYGANRTGRWAGRLVQVQNLRQNHIVDLDTARDLVKAGDLDILEMCFGNVPDTLSQLIRTAFVARPGSRFIVADFSAIEARVIAWLAGEKWRLDVFNTHGKIYEASAAQMFKVPIESVTKGSDLRGKGKVAELACIAEGQLVITDKGLTPIEKVTTKHKVFDGVEFVKHDGVIFKGYKKVITYDGLTATEDHEVFIYGTNRTVQFGYAAASGLRIAIERHSGQSIRERRNNRTGKAMEEKLAKPYGINEVPKLRARVVDRLFQSSTRKIERLPKMLTTSQNTALVRPATYGSEATLRKSERPWISELRSKGNRISIRFNTFRGSLLTRKRAKRLQGIGTGPYRQLQALRTWEPALRTSPNESRQPTKLAYTSMETGTLAVQRNDGSANDYARLFEGANYTKRERSGKSETQKLANDSGEVRVYDILNAGPRNRFVVSGCLVHNCGYQGGPGALIAMGALDMGLKEEDLPGIIKAWRNANKKIVRYWYDVQDAAIEAVETGATVALRNVKFYTKKNIFFIELPSGRRLCYLRPAIRDGKYGKIIVYEGMDQTTKKWGRQDTYGGKLVENIVQAVARDLLAHALISLDKAGFSVVMHVHDEAVIEEPVRSAEEVSRIMATGPEWAKGLPLTADSYETFYYKKD